MGGGALATALAGMVGTIGAGAVAGAVVGYLKDQGVPDEAITVYRDTFDKGGAILAVAVPAEFNRPTSKRFSRNTVPRMWIWLAT